MLGHRGSLFPFTVALEPIERPTARNVTINESVGPGVFVVGPANGVTQVHHVDCRLSRVELNIRKHRTSPLTKGNDRGYDRA